MLCSISVHMYANAVMDLCMQVEAAGKLLDGAPPHQVSIRPRKHKHTHTVIIITATATITNTQHYHHRYHHKQLFHGPTNINKGTHEHIPHNAWFHASIVRNIQQ